MVKGKWTRQDIRYLKKLFPSTPTAEVARAMGRPYEAVKKQASRLGLRKSRRYMRLLGHK